ncbi:TRAP transporter large permease [Vibrio viridaestus]|uniref:TRAP transporter large permease protein n=1 Tax=Vibrio viridaestus TaxID=2487322 RepID=A0A3N9TEH3_9VIBR|nr:TRAP transporter large permease subunit [Vibrio viridaestus]RQW62637.1 TRAP transporter large permease subunit [Vibrio viridaestus]
MTNLDIGLGGILVALILIAIRVPIGVALGLISIAGIALMTNMNVAWGLVSATPYDFAGQWELSAAPMFLFMGYLCSTTNMTQGLFQAMRVYLHKVPGGLAVSSVLASAFFAAASGSSVATSAAMSRIAVPEMLKYNYDKGLATGTIAASGTLGSLIPPSVLLVLYGVYAQVSVGQLFMAGFLPGIMSAGLYILMIMIRVKRNPRLAGDSLNNPPEESKFDSLKQIWPLPVLIAVVLGGIFNGIFSPTEAGAVGACIAAIVAFFRKTLTTKAVKSALCSSAMSTASIFIILIGSLLFTRFLALSGVPTAFSNLILSVSTDTWWILLSVALIYLVLGMFIDSIGLMLLTLPLILPLVQGADLNLVWFGIIIVKLLEVGLVTPPIGLNVYVIKGALGNIVTLPQVFKGVSWFIFMDIIALLLIILIPALSLYLPQQML